jgi:para-aminobenzoate synthetase component 1
MTQSVGVAHALLEIQMPPGLLPLAEALHRDDYFWWLDSASPTHPLCRFSFLGADPYWVLRADAEGLSLQGRRDVGRDARTLLGLDAAMDSAVFEQRFQCDALSATRSLLPALTEEIESSIPFLGGAVGYFGYELGRAWEPSLGRSSCQKAAGSHQNAAGAHQQAAGAGQTPDMALLFVDGMYVFDHAAERCFASALGFADSKKSAQEKAQAVAQGLADQVKVLLERRQENVAASGATSIGKLVSAQGYAEKVENILQDIAQGDVYQACLTHRIELDTDRDPWRMYSDLRKRNPAPFASYLSLPEVTVLSSSPERFLKVQGQGEIESRPIKGTRPRGGTQKEDDALREALKTSDKDRAENLMIADLVRNDLGRVCEVGSIYVEALQQVEEYATVFQMVTTVRGQLRESSDALDALRACFPPGSMTGAPKIAAMRILESLEPVERGVYSGGLGYLDCRGGMDLSVVIRTLLLYDTEVTDTEATGTEAALHVGGGIVADSVPAEEYQESLHKARAWLDVLKVLRPE